MAEPGEGEGKGAGSEHAPGLSPREFARWIWRQLTSMRIALMLLFLLALAAIPGSVVPQTGVDSVRAAQWQDQHPALTPIYDRLGLFDVYGSVWFSAIYLLLMISLVGCILPRCATYWRAFRAKPPKPPANLGRLPEHRQVEGDHVATATALLRDRGFRIRTGDGWAAAEKGYLREAGNLLFHVSLLVVLAGVAIGSLFGYQGGVMVVTGSGFANSLSQYDEFRPGRLFNPEHLNPMRFTVDDFDVTFIDKGRSQGMAHKFAADMTWQRTPTSAEQTGKISVNHPLSIDGTDVFLIGHGYAPVITVRDAEGEVVWSGSTIFLPEDSSFRSFGVVKVPDISGGEDLGFEGEFYPTYATRDKIPFSAYPDAKDPLVSLQVYRGDLGMNDGVPQSVYALDKDGLVGLKRANGKPFRANMGLGQSVTLPDGLGTVTFEKLDRFVKLQISRSPADRLALLGVSLALLGLMGSLFIRPRRVWARVREVDGRWVTEVAGLDRSSGGDLGADLDEMIGALSAPDDKDYDEKRDKE